jgi:D-amino-acid dehydrogenase
MRLGKHIAVVGAGVVGLAIALRLRRDGYRVTLYDPNEPGSQTSAGNAALIMTAQATPLADPAIWRKLPALMRRNDGPLAIRKSHLPKLMPWLWHFSKNNTRARHQQIAETLAPMTTGALDVWVELTGPHDAPRHFRQNGLLYVFKSRKGFRAAKLDAQFRHEYGIPYEVIEAEELRQMEPALREGLAGGILYPDAAQCLDPRKLSEAISGMFRTSGGEVQRLSVRQLQPVDRNEVRVITEEGERSFDEVVVAAGISSPTLLKPLGIKPKLASERGYHLMLREPEISLNRPIIAGEARFAITPLSGGIRLAGTSEFAHPEAEPDWDRADRLFDQTKDLLPEIDGEESASRWCASRDSTPDGLPCVGHVKKHRSILCAFGHGHMGLTLGATTAQLIADQIGGRDSFIDIGPLAPDRF